MNKPENTDHRPVALDVKRFREWSIVLAFLSMLASTGYLVLVRAIQDMWGDPQAALTGTKYLPFILSNLAAFIGALMIVSKRKAGLWIYLVGQALFLFVAYHEVTGDARNRWDDFLQLFTVLAMGISLLTCILQSIFTLRSEI